MPIFSWGARRQLAVFAAFAAIVLLAVLGFIYFFQPQPTCFDNKQNQGEEGVDCGGPCVPCSAKIHDLAVLWTRFFEVRPGEYDVAALVENSNQFLKTSKFTYALKLYDGNNVLIAIRENTTFIQPGEKFLVFEPAVQAGSRTPKSALLEMRSVSWESGEPKPLSIDVTGKNILLEASTSPRLEATLKNQSNQIYKNIEADAILLGEGGDVLGVSRTIVDNLDISEAKKIVFTWPGSIAGVLRADVFLRQMP